MGDTWLQHATIISFQGFDRSIFLEIFVSNFMTDNVKMLILHGDVM